MAKGGGRRSGPQGGRGGGQHSGGGGGRGGGQQSGRGGGRGSGQQSGRGGGRGGGQQSGRGGGRGSGQQSGRGGGRGGGQQSGRGGSSKNSWTRGKVQGGFQAGQDKSNFFHSQMDSYGLQGETDISVHGCKKFVIALRKSTNSNLGNIIKQSTFLWNGAWKQASTMDKDVLEGLLTTLARIPIAVDVGPPPLQYVCSVGNKFMGQVSTLDASTNSQSDPKLQAVELMENVVRRLMKFVWEKSVGDVKSKLSDLLAQADQMLNGRLPAHRKARERITNIFDELDHSWSIRYSTQRMDNQKAHINEPDASWRNPTISWLSNWDNFQPLKLPKMKTPGKEGNGVYNSVDEYFETTIKLWVGMTFVDGHNTLLPSCRIRIGEKPCGSTLYPIHSRIQPGYRCYTHDCRGIVTFICSHRGHDRGFCQPCADTQLKQLRGPPSNHASTHIYDGTITSLDYDGTVHIVNVQSRRPPSTPIHWRTTNRLASPNLVGIILIPSRGSALQEIDHIYWGKVSFHGEPRDEYIQRERGQLRIELLEYSIDEEPNPLISKDIAGPTSIAVIDCMTFVPEFIPVLKGLERQKLLPIPFQYGAQLNLVGRNVYNPKQDELFEYESSDEDSVDCNIDDETGYQSLVRQLIEKSTLDPIVQIRRDSMARRTLETKLVTLVKRATLDDGQLESFFGALHHPVHCTQGPPGTGKSYLGVVIVRALLIIRKLWMAVCPSIGQPPILVLSYKNHAIDEFLCDLVKTEPNLSHPFSAPLIRIGGGCTEPQLHRYQETNYISTSSKILTLKKKITQIRSLVSKVRSVQNLLGVIYESRILIMSSRAQDQQREEKNLESKIIENASISLRKLLVILRNTPDLESISSRNNIFEIENDTKENLINEDIEDESSPECESEQSIEPDKVSMFDSIENTFLTEHAFFSTDLINLYHGIMHVDPNIDIDQMLYKWIQGFVPPPICSFFDNVCSNVAETDSKYCIQHRCHAKTVKEAPCTSPVTLEGPYCKSHTCGASLCKVAKLEQEQTFCAKHACFVCVANGQAAQEAIDDIPRNVCANHTLCYASSGEEFCSELAVNGTSYCVDHQGIKCTALDNDNFPCMELAISRGIPFCALHRDKISNNTNSHQCKGYTKKKKRCKSRPQPGSEYCIAHKNQASLKIDVKHIAESKISQGELLPDCEMSTEDIQETVDTSENAKRNVSSLTASSLQDYHSQKEQIASTNVSLHIDIPSNVVKSEALEGGAYGEVWNNLGSPRLLKPTIELTVYEDTKDYRNTKGTDGDANLNVNEEQTNIIVVDDQKVAIDDSKDTNDSDSLDEFEDIQKLDLEDDYEEPEYLYHLRDVDEVAVRDAEDINFEATDEASSLANLEVISDKLISFHDWDWNMTVEERWRSIYGVISSWDPNPYIIALRKEFEDTKKEIHYENIRQRAKIYEGRAIIGGTITGCVSRLESIQSTNPFAIIVEEASEVAEPLLYSCFGTTTCKLEMIGDHLQLQPSIMSRFEFERINNINISLFERLILAPESHKVPSSVLSIQRRMRRNIADLTRDYYNSITTIEDHASCSTKTIQSAKLPYVRRFQTLQTDLLKLCEGMGREIPGVSPHIYFWSHGGSQSKASVGLSRVNKQESIMACNLAKYLVTCGVPDASIAILTPYKGQLMLIRKTIMQAPFNMVSRSSPNSRQGPSCIVSTVDRFQGDEADIVIVSLVVDGKSKTPFVKLQNRMIVLLSRARIGMYILGNETYFAGAPPHWQDVLQKLKSPAITDSSETKFKVNTYSGAQMGDHLPICCPRHRDQKRNISNPTELQLGFCDIRCEEALPCTHACGLQCHWPNINQHAKHCQTIVDSPCCHHPRELKCKDICTNTTIIDALRDYKCDALVDLQLHCTHVQRVRCHIEMDIAKGRMRLPKCTEPSIAPFVYPDCMHSLKCSCDDYYQYQKTQNPPPCVEEIEYYPSCGHEISLKCYVHKKIVNGNTNFTCATNVQVQLPRCGHRTNLPCPTAITLESWGGPMRGVVSTVNEGEDYGKKDYTCKEMVSFRPKCGHTVKVECNKAFDMAKYPPKCTILVDFQHPDCGHKCHATCHELEMWKQRASIDNMLTGFAFLSNALGSKCPLRCTEKVTMTHACGHEELVKCIEQQENSRECTKTTEIQRPDCYHKVKIPCKLLDLLNSWLPWKDADQSIVNILHDSGVLVDSITSPIAPPVELSKYLKSCNGSLVFRRDSTCGHDITLPCNKAKMIIENSSNPPLCDVLCAKELPCGHKTNVKCSSNISKLKCHEKVLRKCWNFSVCDHQVDSLCFIQESHVECESLTSWTCAANTHSFELPICRKGVPQHCPDCIYEKLKLEIQETNLLVTTNCEPIWPPEDCPNIKWPLNTTTLSLSKGDKIDFCKRKLQVLRRFKNCLDLMEDKWSRPIFNPQYIPVFAMPKQIKAKGNAKFNSTRFEIKDFGTKQTWNNLEAREYHQGNLKDLKIPSKKTSDLVFGFVFSLGLNTTPTDAPSGSYTPRHYKWILNQTNKLAFDCAFFPAKPKGSIYGPGKLLVWEPFAMFPVHVLRADLSQLHDIQLQCEDKESIWRQHTRYIQYDKPEIAGHLASKDGGNKAAHFPVEHFEKLENINSVLPYDWMKNLALLYPWSGKSLLTSSQTISESLEQRLEEKLSFMKINDVNKKKNSPIVGIRQLRNLFQNHAIDEAKLFQGLELLNFRKDDMTEAVQCIQEYCERVHQKQNLHHPLILVAIARILHRESKRSISKDIFELFSEIYPIAVEDYLSHDELDSSDEATSNTRTSADMSSSRNPSPQDIWEKLKEEHRCSSQAMENLLGMTGLTKVKHKAVGLFKTSIKFCAMPKKTKEKNMISMNYCFMGNPGTGKTTVAKLFAQILYDSGMRSGNTAVMTSAQELKDEGSDAFRTKIKSAIGGILFIDEAYDLDPAGDPKGRSIVSELLMAAEEHRKDLSIILAGYEEDIQKKLYAYNDGIQSRFEEVFFEDFDYTDLRKIWDSLVKDREWTCSETTSIVASRRLSRAANRKGFGNARAVRQLLDRSIQDAITNREIGKDVELQPKDVLGERPTQNEKLTLTLAELNTKIGWKPIKERISELVDICDKNYDRALQGIDCVPVILNRMFIGNPGTGKTTCAYIYGRILKHLGFLSNGDVVKKTASDFIGQHVGQSQTNTNNILKLAAGKVLLIDEAYNLNDELYGKQVLDTLVEKVQGSDTDDIAVILIGYEHQMKEMLRVQNPGLARRFPIEYALFFDDYDDSELFDILLGKCAQKKVYCPMDVAECMLDQLSKQRDRPNFGNAGSVEMMVKAAMANATKRPLIDNKIHLTLADIESEQLRRTKDAEGSVVANDPLALLDNLYAIDDIKHELTRLRIRMQVAEDEGDELPEIGHFVFRGSPGTGKTTVARVMGKIFHLMGFLGSDRVVETSGLDLTGEYVGQTKKKVEEQFDQARGGILFIDEAYELGKGAFGEEAMTSLVAGITNPMYKGMVIIIAGYPADIDEMMNRNAGLKSRFTRYFEFHDWQADDCINFMKTRSGKERFTINDEAIESFRDLFDKLQQLPGFGNGRDVDKVWKCALECRSQRVSMAPEIDRRITLQDAQEVGKIILTNRLPPSKPLLCKPSTWTGEAQVDESSKNSRKHSKNVDTSVSHISESELVEIEDDGNTEEATSVARDPGVDEATWIELERAKKMHEQMLKEMHEQMLKDMQDEEDRRKQEELERKMREYAETQKKLRRLMKCPAGYNWTQVGSGWRCGGGSHFVSNEELERKFTTEC